MTALIDRGARPRPRPATAALPAIPVIDVGAGGLPAVLAAERRRAAALLAAGRRLYSGPGILLGDRLACRWLRLADNPYLEEIDAIAAVVGAPGAHALNTSYEWSCTSGVGADPGGAGSRLLRVLDWPMDGLGRYLVLLRHGGPAASGSAGPWLNLTWPGFVGVLTGLAPGRFAAAINQPPMRRRTPLLAADWVLNRLGVWRSRGLPPAHLLRRVFETCRSYAEARDALATTPVCLPALFLLSGVRPEEGCVIERLEDRAVVHDGPACAANHWRTPALGGDQRGPDSPARQGQMEALLRTAGDGLDWPTPPMLNEDTRLVAAANAATGVLSAQGWERDGPATAVLRLAAAEAAAAGVTER